MAEVIRMPLLSDTMKEGVIAEWHKKVGDKVKADDVLADVETDKATMEVMGYAEGTLLYVGVEKGKAAKVNDVIAIIGKEGEDYKALLDKETTGAAAAPAAAQSAAPAKEEAPAPPKEEKPAAAPAAIPAGVTVIRMPLLSDTMTEGKIVAWNKKVGDVVKNDDVLADVETDKATMEVMGYADGTLLHIGVPAGSAAKVNDIIAIVGKPGTDISGILNAPAPSESKPAAPAEKPAAEQKTEPAATTQAAAQSGNAASGDERIKISPLARKIAQDKGIDLHQLNGSGDGGRIVKRDIDNYTPQAAKPAATAATSSTAQAAPVQAGTESHTDTPVSQMRKIIAKRLAESKFSAPHFYLKITVTMDKAMEARKQINELGGTKVSFNDLIIKAAAMALRKHPEVNSSWMGDFIRTNHHISIGSAIAVDEGLIVPVIKFADQLSLTQIAATATDLYGKARNKKIQPSEFSGNTFTISNLGMMGIDEFTAIINPPDSCILAVGNIVPTPVVENGTVVVRQILKLTLSCDHRVVDGAVGAKFLQTLKTFIENPVTMLA
ncbi:MAG: pyruvate dehydrogenase complex dihydrolipoamide acetyltransferase [Chitinophagaceae bacterium]|nr:pyruvate dehydrogenase complex dihydrolipoamide acetyltransferase [Chitinophagaceae bacterium]